MPKSVYELELHELTSVPISGRREIEVLRVAGGWIYTFYGEPTFVPYNEDMNKEFSPF